jgi:hypothetical protein
MNDEAKAKLQQEMTVLVESYFAVLLSETDEGVEPSADRREAVSAAVDDVVGGVMEAVDRERDAPTRSAAVRWRRNSTTRSPRQCPKPSTSSMTR